MGIATDRAVVYILWCADGSLYTGWTNDLGARLVVHARGDGSRLVRSRRPFVLAAWWSVEDRATALREEARFKRLRRSEKLAALALGQVFGRQLRNAPTLAIAQIAGRISPKGVAMATHTPPTGTELTTLVDEAARVQARITTPKGEIIFRFFPNDAPQHSAAFIKLSREGFYDGLIFHRVEPGFVIQGGCPTGTGMGGPGYNLDAEFNERPHRRGTVAMARSSNPNSAGSQFYICLGDARFLDRQYTVFGETVAGQDVVDKIGIGDQMTKVQIEPTSSSLAS